MTRYHHLFIAFVLLFITAGGRLKAAASIIGLQDLRCEQLVNPSGIDALHPRLSWEITGTERGIQQLSYELIVASSLQKLEKGVGDIWDSRWVNSDHSSQVKYEGKRLKSEMTCYWQVRIRTNKGTSGWSKPASWSMGLIHPQDWKAKWIGWDHPFAWDSVSKFSRLSARYLRKDFVSDLPVKRAVVYISGLGLYELSVNGHKIGDQVLAPAPTDYSKTILYNCFDITECLNKGANTLGVILGNGRFFTMRQKYKPWKWHNFGFPQLRLQLDIQYLDGSFRRIISDRSWKLTANGPIRSDNEYDGEDYDATKEMPGWDKPGYQDSSWLKATIVPAPGGQMKAQMNENMRVMQELKPRSITRRSAGVYVLDMGQNMAGWLKISLAGTGNRGREITLRFAESLQPDGSLYTDNLRDAKATDHYTLKGEAIESWAPHFIYHGFRYAEISNYPKGETPRLEDFTGAVVYDAMQTMGDFSCSDTTINQVYHNASWSIRSDYKGMPVDCPQRNERQPWLGDRNTGAYGESFIFDNGKLYAKWLRDICDAQTKKGSIPDVAPNFWYYYKDDVTWPSTYLSTAEMLYHQYGDRKAIIRYYHSMKKWVDYMRARYMKDDLIYKDSYGDWCVPPESPLLIHSRDSSRMTPPGLLATAVYYHDLVLMEQFSAIAGHPGNTRRYRRLAGAVKLAFNRKFYHPGMKYYGNNSITSNLLPLAFHLTDDRNRVALADDIVEKITRDFHGHIGTGVIGTQWLMRMLTESGHADLAFRIATSRDYPGWGYMAAKGATTIWELWNGNTAAPKMNSQNHVMLLGDLVIWLFEKQAAIQSDSAGIAFKQIIMKPCYRTGMQWVKASFHSVYGVIQSSWKKTGTRFNWQIQVPPNTTAQVYIPSGDPGKVPPVMEGDTPAALAAGVTFLRNEKAYSVYQVGSGTYHFVSYINSSINPKK